MNCLFCGSKLEETEKICPKCEKPVCTPIQIEGFQFVRVSPALSDAIAAKKGFFGGGDIKKLAQCVADGNAWTAPVFVEETFTYTENDISMEYANIMDDAGCPCVSAVPVLDVVTAGGVIDGEDLEGNRVEAVLLRYQIGKQTNHLLISKESAQNIPSAARGIIGMMYRHLQDRQGPALEGSLIDRLGKGFGKLFGMSGEKQ